MQETLPNRIILLHSDYKFQVIDSRRCLLVLVSKNLIRVSLAIYFNFENVLLYCSTEKAYDQNYSTGKATDLQNIEVKIHPDDKNQLPVSGLILVIF